MRRLLRVVVLALLCTRLLYPGSDSAATVLVVSITGVIHPVTVDILDSAIAQAQREGCRLIILRLNTPGGFLTATRLASQRMLNSPIPVATWVGPIGAQAASAGFYLLEAGDVAAMAPGTSTGAAHPVLLVGTQDPTLAKKIENDAAASLRSIVTRRGRNAEMSDKAVVESRSFTDKEAMAEHLIEVVAIDERDLVNQLNGRDVVRFDGSRVRLQVAPARLIEYQATLSQQVQMAMSNPSIALGALILGLLLLYLEFTTPGIIAPGVAGIILVLLGLGALSVLPVTGLGISLLVLAFVLFILEAKIVSHGVLATGGVISMVAGALLLVDSPISELRVPLMAALGLALPFALIASALTALVVRSKRAEIQSGAESFRGQMATAITSLGKPGVTDGKVNFGAEVWDATADADVPAGTTVRVVGRTGLTLQVEPMVAADAKVTSARAGG